MLPTAQTYRFNTEAYRQDMNALLSVAHHLRHIAAASLQYAAAARQREAELLEECNRLGHLAQAGRDWREEAERYLVIIASLDEELRHYERINNDSRPHN